MSVRRSIRDSAVQNKVRHCNEIKQRYQLRGDAAAAEIK